MASCVCTICLYYLVLGHEVVFHGLVTPYMITQGTEFHTIHDQFYLDLQSFAMPPFSELETLCNIDPSDTNASELDAVCVYLISEEDQGQSLCNDKCNLHLDEEIMPGLLCKAPVYLMEDLSDRCVLCITIMFFGNIDYVRYLSNRRRIYIINKKCFN